MTTEFVVDEELPLMSTSFIDFLQEYPLSYENFDTYISALLYKINSPHGEVVHLPVLAEHLSNYQKIAQYAEKILGNAAYFSVILSQAVESYLVTISLRANVQIDFVCETDEQNVHSELMGRLMAISGNVVRVSMNVPEIARAVYRCTQCNELQDAKFVFLDDFEVSQCENCHSNELVLVPDLCSIDEQQKARIETETQQINCVLFGPNAKALHAGDPVKLIGFPVPAVEPVLRQRSKKLVKEIEAGYAIQNENEQTQIDEERRQGNDIIEARTEILDDRSTEVAFRLEFYVTRVVALERGHRITDLFGLNLIDDATNAENEQERYLQRVVDKYNLPPERMELIDAAAQDPLFEAKLIASVAPFIHSNSQIKVAIILELLGGVEKIAFDGAHARADINILLVGDPSTAKSQFLKFVAGLSDRAIYTSGKSASAAGLTAAVAMDQDTGEWGIEPGAMLRANGGVCCIDEFDKISPQDVSALHECMEQQQVSISKAGVSATMEAKTAVLAAMNPLFGRYNKMLSLKQNIIISSAILSRFDLVFVLCDQPNEDVDRAIAKRILGVMMGEQDALETPFSREFIEDYIKAASCQMPIMSADAQNRIKQCWIEMRQEDLKISRKNQRITIRQLESLIRLSEAYAKLHMSKEVTESHVNDAFELYKSSIIMLQQESYKYEVFLEGQQVEASLVTDERDPTSVTENKQFSITITEIDRLCVVAKFSLERQGRTQLTFDEFKALVYENLSYQEATPDELRAISDAIVRSMVLEHEYLTKSGDQLQFDDDDILEFTHLAPSI